MGCIRAVGITLVPHEAVNPGEDLAGQVVAPAEVQKVEALFLRTRVDAGGAQRGDYFGSVHAGLAREAESLELPEGGSRSQRRRRRRA